MDQIWITAIVCSPLFFTIGFTMGEWWCERKKKRKTAASA